MVSQVYFALFSLSGFDFLESSKTQQAEQLAEKLNLLSFRGALRAEESLCSYV